MDHDVLVEEGIEQGRILIERLQEERLTIQIAAWVRRVESDAWQIYLGAEAPGVDIRREGGRIVLRALARMTEPTIWFTYINLRGLNDPQIVDLLALRQRYPTVVGRKLKTRRRIGRENTRGLYLYPASFDLPEPDQVVHSVLGLLDRSGPTPPSVVTFRDGSRIHAVPVGIRLNTPDGARIDWHDVVTRQDRTVPAAEVVSIL